MAMFSSKVDLPMPVFADDIYVLGAVSRLDAEGYPLIASIGFGKMMLILPRYSWLKSGLMYLIFGLKFKLGKKTA